jgi:hypothetical protein
MTIEMDSNILLEVLASILVMSFLKNLPSLVPSHPLFSHAIVDAQKKLCDWTRFSLHPLNCLTNTHTVL